jgi:hypothetical protein
MPTVLERLSVLADEVSANLVEALDWAVRNGRMVDGANVSNLSDADVTPMQGTAQTLAGLKKLLS